MPWWLTLANSILAMGSAIFGFVAVARPAAFAPPAVGAAREAAPASSAGRFYPAMYAARSVPLGLLAAGAVWLAPDQPLTALVLATAAAAQLGDIAIALSHRLPGMAAGAALTAACHIAGALAATG